MPRDMRFTMDRGGAEIKVLLDALTSCPDAQPYFYLFYVIFLLSFNQSGVYYFILFVVWDFFFFFNHEIEKNCPFLLLYNYR